MVWRGDNMCHSDSDCDWEELGVYGVVMITSATSDGAARPRAAGPLYAMMQHGA